jgi:hypothetical protein
MLVGSASSIPQGSGFSGPDINYSGRSTRIRQLDVDRDYHSGG